MKVTLIDKEDNSCVCVGKHIPLPHKLFRVEGGNDSATVCPTALLNLLALVEEHARHGGNPPGSVRKHYSEYVQKLHALLFSAENIQPKG